MHTPILIAIWFAGDITAGIALLIPIYSDYVIVGAAGWFTICISSGLILYEIKRIRTDDRKKEIT
jgi:hypothetical protein